MLKVYYGRENIDKNRFMFDKISRTMSDLGKEGYPEKVILLVPDQYTLQAERDAFAHLKVRGLMDLEILSQNRLISKVLNETGGATRVHIDKHGRHMLLAGILSDENENLSVFPGISDSHSFISMTNNFIAELKQFDIEPSSLQKIIHQMEEDSLLKRKLCDINLIFKRYEERIKGKYTDTEDYISLFTSQIQKSKTVKYSEFWIYGFDYLTPKSLQIIQELNQYSKGVNILLTYDDVSNDRELFQLTASLIGRLKSITSSINIIRIGGPHVIRKPELKHLESHLFAYPYEVFDKDSVNDHPAITLCKAANYYGETETAASFISQLVRNKEYRYRDIVVICNDMENRGKIIKRVFEAYHIPVFMDQKRRVMHNPGIVFITSLLNVINEGWLYEDLFRLLKTGLCNLTQDDIEELENYALQYRIWGNRWKKEFTFGKTTLDEENFNHLENLRNNLVDLIGGFENSFKAAASVKEKTAVLYAYLSEHFDIPGQMEALYSKLTDEGKYEQADEIGQIWENIVSLLDQLVELIGDQSISNRDFALMLNAGFDSMEIGIIPPTVDQVVVGTMQRTRVGRIKAMVVIGANDGVLPAAPDGDDLLSQDEKSLLLKQNIEICKDNDLRGMEERLGIYKNLSKPENHLWIGYSTSDPEGRELRPSIIFDRLKQIFPKLPVEKDIQNREDPMELIEMPESSLLYLTEALRKAVHGEKDMDKPWQAAYNWYIENKYPYISMIQEGLSFTNRLDKLERSLVEKLYQRKDGEDITELKISPSRLERFSRCPFSHLVTYGLAPEERRIFEVAGREVGDIYHEALMKLSESLTVKGLDITDEKSPWMTITKEKCIERINIIIDQIASSYKEGMLTFGGEEYYRTNRMKEALSKAAWVMVEHVRQGRIEQIYFEEVFGRSGTFPPLVVDMEDHSVLIEGKIDRIDVLPGGFVKIIDYKSGKEHFDSNEVKRGWRLQLMLYLKAAVQGLESKRMQVKPAGVFYFEIADPLIDATEYTEEQLQEKLRKKLRRNFKLDGVVLDDPEVIESIDGDFNGYSEILPVFRKKDGLITGNRLLNEDEFNKLRNTVDKTIEELCSSLASGVIDIRPKKTKYETACKYCEYKSICNFELAFDGCSYDVVK